MYCKNCGFKSENGANFCTKCGKRLEKIEESKVTTFLNNNFSKLTGADAYKKRIAELEDMIDKINKNKIDIESKVYLKFKNENKKLNSKNDKLISENKELEEKINNSKEILSSINKELEENINNSKEILSSMEKQILEEEYNIYQYDFINSDECQNKLSLLKLDEKELVKNDRAIIPYSYAYNTIPKKSLDNNKRQLLNLFNSECDLIISNVSVTNIETSRNKINKCFQFDNKIFETDFIQISRELLILKLDELTLIYNYHKRKKEEQEQQKAIRQQMIEEEKVRKEIEKEKQRIEKEEKQFNGEIKKLMQYMQKSDNDIEKQLYIDKINELEGKIKMLTKDKEMVINREQNTRAGYVYIISNIGSFGENVYKIGMTRRLEPMDRIKELGDASVPFEFDVHALIFSEDAPSLETLLHKQFEKNRVNKVNSRKEFYKVDLAEIEKVVKENFNSTTEFITIPKAEEYNQSKLN